MQAPWKTQSWYMLPPLLYNSYPNEVTHKVLMDLLALVQMYFIFILNSYMHLIYTRRNHLYNYVSRNLFENTMSLKRTYLQHTSCSEHQKKLSLHWSVTSLFHFGILLFNNLFCVSLLSQLLQSFNVINQNIQQLKTQILPQNMHFFTGTILHGHATIT